MKNLRRHLWVAAILPLSIHLQAAQDNPNYKALTLKEALSIGLSRNHALKSSESGTALSREKEVEAYNKALPELNFNSAYRRLTNLYQYENGLNHEATEYKPEKNVYEFGLDASVPLYTGGRLQGEKQKAHLSSELSALREGQTRHVLSLEIVTVYLQLCKMQQQQQLIQDKLHEDSLMIRQTEALRRNGASTRNEVMRTRLQQSNHRMMQTHIVHEIRIGEHRLGSLLALDEGTELHIVAQSIHEFDASAPDSLYSGVPTQNDDILLAAKQLQLQKADEQLVQSNILPQIALVGNYTLMNPNYKFYPPQPYFYRMGMLGVTLKYSISEVYKNCTKSRQLQLAEKQRVSERDEAEIKVGQALFSAQQKLSEADERIQIAEEAIQQASENYRTVKQKYIESLSLITELIDADNAYLEAQSTLISQKIDRQQKLFQLRYILGKL